jgi:hypothetical protein
VNVTTLLYLKASPRKTDSQSIQLAEVYLTALRSSNPDLVVDTIDVWEEGLPAFDGDKAAAKMTVIAGQQPDGPQRTAWDEVVAIANRERNEQNLTAVIAPLAHELGVQNVDDLGQRLVEATMIFTRGAVMSAGDDLPQLRLLIQDLHTMIRSAILEAARVNRERTTSRGHGRDPTV